MDVPVPMRTVTLLCNRCGLKPSVPIPAGMSVWDFPEITDFLINNAFYCPICIEIIQNEQA